MECLVDATPEDLTEAIPFEWKDTKTAELPQVGEKEHSWIVLDKHILLKHPLDYWAENQLENKIPMVFGKIFFNGYGYCHSNFTRKCKKMRNFLRKYKSGGVFTF